MIGFVASFTIMTPNKHLPTPLLPQPYSPYPSRWTWLRNPPRSKPKLAFIDFDGTLSRIRAGWLPIMRKMMEREIRWALGSQIDEQTIRDVTGWIAANNGKPTWHQMECLRLQLHSRGAQAKATKTYLETFNRLLHDATEPRRKELKLKKCRAEDWQVPGARKLLETLSTKGFYLHLASGTEKAAVLEEAHLLGFDDLFKGQISAPDTGDPSFSKEEALFKVLANFGLRHDEVLVIGDGPVEIEIGSRNGCWTVGVAGHDDNRMGLDPWVAEKLEESGANALIDFYNPVEKFLDWILAGPKQGILSESGFA